MELTGKCLANMNTGRQSFQKNCMYALNSLCLAPVSQSWRYWPVGQTALCCGAVLCILGVFSILASTHKYLVAPSPLLLEQPKKLPVSKVPRAGRDKITPTDENHWCKVMKYIDNLGLLHTLERRFRRILIKLLTVGTRIGQKK